MLSGVIGVLGVAAEFLIIYDDESDSTLPALKTLPASTQIQFRVVRNSIGPGPANALKSGFMAAGGEAVVVMMADRSDDPRVLRAMVEKFDAGYDLVCGSRYMAGGEQVGGPWLKGKLSRMAGVSLCTLGLPSHDATNSFRLYRTQLLRSLDLSSTSGFEIN